MTYTKQQIIDAFVDVDLPTEGYNNQGFYEASEQRLRYVLVTMDMAPSCLTKDQYDLFKTDNKFYNCIEFWYDDPAYSTGCHYKVNNPELLQELMDMDYDALEDYVNTNGYEWLGDDFIHIEEYLDFVSAMQDEWQFVKGDYGYKDEYMEIIKKPWITDKVKGYKSDNRFELAYRILLESAVITDETRARLDAVGVV